MAALERTARNSKAGGTTPHSCPAPENKDLEPLAANACLAGTFRIRRHPSGSSWAADFFFIVASAFLLLIANLLPGYWYLSFIALIPFLWRILKSGPRRAFWLGLTYGLIFLLVWKLNALSTAPFSAGFKIILGAVLFAFFGWGASRAKWKLGFNPLLVALLWVGLEFSLIKLGFGTGLLEAPFLLSIAPFFYGLGALFGFLAISFVIVLLNSVLILAVEKLVSLAKARRMTFSAGQRFLKPFSTPGLFAQRFYLLPEDRGPPVYSLNLRV